LDFFQAARQILRRPLQVKKRRAAVKKFGPDNPNFLIYFARTQAIMTRLIDVSSKHYRELEY
jgi:hypothetical protein